MKAVAALSLVVGLIACADPEAPADAGSRDVGPGDAGSDAGSSPDSSVRDAGPIDGGACTAINNEVVHFDTDDGVTLEAALYTQGEVDRPLVVLVHMIPPANTRANYPTAFIDTLRRSGAGQTRVNIINLDRRGAGGSGGVAMEAYEGPNGALDIKAAVNFFKAHPCGGAGFTRLALIGASNGTTSVLDYAVRSETDASLLAPKSIVFLTGGTYTENQFMITDHVAWLDTIRPHFVYSNDERAWSASFSGLAGTTGWGFVEYGIPGHGTGLFASNPESVAYVADVTVEQVNR